MRRNDAAGARQRGTAVQYIKTKRGKFSSEVAGPISIISEGEVGRLSICCGSRRTCELCEAPRSAWIPAYAAVEQGHV
jgi:hypothetical protein